MDTREDKGTDTNFSTQGHAKPTTIRRRGLLVKRPDLAKMVCKSLGFDFNDLTLKTREELYDMKKTPEINNIIYDHYKKRYQRKINQVEAKIKEMVHLGKIDMFHMMDHPGARRCSSSGSHDNGSRKNSQGHHYDSFHDAIHYAKTARPPKVFHVEFDSDRGSDDQVEVQENEIARNVIKNYRNKLTKVQVKWDEEIKHMTNKPTDDPNKMLKHAMQDQVGKLNRSIEKAEKYAQSIIDSNTKRENLREKLFEREQLSIQLKKKLEKEKQEVFKKNQETFGEKLKQIKAKQRDYNAELRRNGAKLQQRFGELEIKMNNVDVQRKEMAKSRSIEFSNKIVKAKEIRDFEYEELFKSFRDEESRCQNYLEVLKSDRKMRCDDSARAFDEAYKKAVQKRTNFSNERDASTIERLMLKSQGAESLRVRLTSEIKKKAKENSMERETTFKRKFEEVMRNKQEWRNNVVKSYRESQERIKEYQNEKANELLVKKELNHLRRQDQTDNFADLKRIQEMRNVQILEKEKTRSLKQTLLKEQTHILSLARLDVDRKMKVKVDDMISSAVRGGNKSVELRRPKRASDGGLLVL